jgi:predicted RNase H-like HicB family nuclease
MSRRYVALVDGHAGAYGVVIPDLPGCTSAGATIDEALVNIQEAVNLWADAIEGQGAPFPQPRTLEAVLADPEVAAELAAGAATVLISIIRESGQPVRADISLDRGLLDAIDEVAAERGLTRSAFLASAARDKIANG